MGETNIQRRERIKEMVKAMNLTSDFFLGVALEDKEACAYVLQILMGRSDIHVKDVKTQYSIRQVGTHSVVFDVFAEDTQGKIYEIEMQTGNKKGHFKRVRYITSSADTAFLDKGCSYTELPELHIFYITTFDIAGAEKTVYDVIRMVKGTHLVFDNGVHEHYVNTMIDDGSSVAGLMKYFKKTDSADMSHGELSRRVKYLKGEEGGHFYMCEIIEKMKRESEVRGEARGRLESLIASVDNVMSKLNLSLENACDTIGITVEEYRKAKEDSEL